MRKVVFDIETQNFFHDVGSNNPADLSISIVCIHDSETDEYMSFLEDELPKLWPILEQTDMLIGYNSDHFDIPLLNKYYPGNLTSIKSLDLLVEIKKSLGKRLKLDSVAQATLGYGKSGRGDQANIWWRNGEIEKIRQYCLDDVKVTKGIYDYAREHNNLKYKDLITGNLRDIELDTSNWEEKEESAMTHSLPF